MSYQSYVIAAYAVFVALLAWDFIAPRLLVSRQLRAARLLAARRRAPVDRHAPLTRE
ncbi:MAG TPA: heme exporter protein CcmD [Luteimonas sp.]|nr:heme exporter protein CcmD [Luteimonas sp.]